MNTVWFRLYQTKHSLLELRILHFYIYIYIILLTPHMKKVHAIAIATAGTSSGVATAYRWGCRCPYSLASSGPAQHILFIYLKLNQII
jgi:uncharacterized membrane protein